MLWKSSKNKYYCCIIFKYKHEFNIKYQDYTYFILVNNKHKMPISKDVSVSIGVHNKKTLISTKGEITAADHDFTKLSLTLSQWKSGFSSWVMWRIVLI